MKQQNNQKNSPQYKKKKHKKPCQNVYNNRLSLLSAGLKDVYAKKISCARVSCVDQGGYGYGLCAKPKFGGL